MARGYTPGILSVHFLYYVTHDHMYSVLELLKTSYKQQTTWKPISRLAVDVRVDGEEETHTEHVRDLT